jgi:hypothetical protein
MAYGYDAEEQLLLFAFAVIVGDEKCDNLGLIYAVDA